MLSNTEKMVMAFVKYATHVRTCTVNDVVAATGLSANEAERILGNLVTKNELFVQGFDYDSDNNQLRFYWLTSDL